jgi:hypothetical protein
MQVVLSSRRHKRQVNLSALSISDTKAYPVLWHPHRDKKLDKSTIQFARHKWRHSYFMKGTFCPLICFILVGHSELPDKRLVLPRRRQ